MATIRSVLDCLPHEALVRLSNLRDLPARTDDDRRERLARSYRGDFEQFFRDLRSQDLFEILRNDFGRGHRVYRLKYVSSYSKEQLIGFLLEFFVHGRIPRDFEEEVLEEEDDEEESEDDEEDDAEDDEEESEDDGDDEEESEDDEDDEEEEDDDDEEEDEEPEAPIFAPGDQHRLLPYFSDVTEEWSRPRLIRRVLDALGLPVPQRLRTERFHALLRRLDALGLEARPDDDEDRPFDPTDEQPSIHDKIRLRWKRPPHDRGLDTASIPGHITVIDGKHTPPRPPSHQPKTWELALLRIKFLTAVPHADRPAQPEWPDAFITSALRGLSLSEQHIKLMATVASQYLMGNHDPLRLLPELLEHHSAHELGALFEDYRRLNRHLADFVEMVIAASHTKGGLPFVPAMRSHDIVRAPHPAHPIHQPVVAAGPPPTAPMPPQLFQPPQPPPRPDIADKNHRSLGALEDMFDERDEE